MTIGKSSKRYSKPPQFLDRASGFYSLLDERGVQTPGEGQPADPRGPRFVLLVENEEKQESGVFDFNKGMMEDDGMTTLLRGKPSHGSSRWRKSSRSKKRSEGHAEDLPANKAPSPATDGEAALEVDVALALTLTEMEQPTGLPYPHLSNSHEADSQCLISRKKSKKERCVDIELKGAKRRTLSNYTRAIDRALRRGWETFIASLHSVTLMPISSSSAVQQHSALVDHR